MKIKRDENGYLEIERAGRFVFQYCPLDPGNPYQSRCGDWCPLFGEPEHDFVPSLHHLSGYAEGPNGKLPICQGRVLVGEIIDERGK